VAAVRVLAAGDPEGHAEELFARAAAGWADHDARSELRALWGAGEAAARAGSARARERLETVEARAVTLGHESLLRRIRRSLRAAGVRRSQPRRTGTGPLSAREEEVLELVAEGLTSPQIAARLSIATSTVQTLVRSAMRKLGARTRIQAAALLRGSHDGPN
jgi:DNA-binding NarL/FixJ family response regulator